jgi:hypothetical protein
MDQSYINFEWRCVWEMVSIFYKLKGHIGIFSFLNLGYVFIYPDSKM